MKKKYLFAIITILFCYNIKAQQVWGHRYADEQADQNITIDATESFTASVEWGTGTWGSSDFGYGTTTDGTGWTWSDLPWFQDGDSPNKRLKSTVTINTAGTYYYAYRIIKDGVTSYQFGNDAWSENQTVINAVSTITVTNTWTGNSDTSWSDGGNWTGGVAPTTSVNAIIPNLANDPIIASSTGAVANNITISDGVLTVESGGSLITEGTVTGNITYNVNVANVNWHLISSPVTSEQYDDTWVTNNSIASGTNDNRGIATYDNTSIDTTTEHWRYFQAGGTTTFGTGIGYSLKRTGAGDYAFTGTYPDGTITPAISTNVNDWNLIGNPYPSYLDIAAFITENTTTNDNLTDEFHSVYVWNATAANYDNLETGYIHPGQAFFINSKVDGNATITEAMQSHQTGITFYKSANTSIELTVSNATSSKSTKINYLDGKTASLDAGFDIGMFNGVTSDIRIYTHLLENNEGIAFARQALPNTDLESLVVPVGVKAAANAEITISAEALNLPEGIKIFLEDKTTNTFTRLDEANSEYKITLAEAANGTGRFYLHTTQSALSLDTNINFENVSVFKTNNSTLRIVGLQQGKTTVKLFNILGKQILNSSFNSNGVKEVTLPRLAKGVYIVQISSEAGMLNKKIILE